ncbi:ammonium transporter [Paenibacillus xylaniclasticus]|uniref:ammonium transporter n=1 Tax=Paenibacillus xylaniclasticus TaxID=588083 RepID=UPI0035A2484E
MNTGDNAWVLASTALVLLMFLPGLALFYGSMLGQKSMISTIMMVMSSLVIVTFVWVLFGYSFTFGPSVNGIIGGLDYLGFKNVGGEAMDGLGITHMTFAVFQSMFCAITVAIIAGAVVERMRFSAWVIFSALWAILIYAPMAHWVWGGGWLADVGALDFAGGTVIHILSGVSALTAAVILGPRKSYTMNRTSPPHNLVFFFIGGMMLWIGWMGFDGGTALEAGPLASLAVSTTHIAAVAGVIGWLAMEWIVRKKPTLVGAITGAIAAMVAITPAAGFVSIPSSIWVGGLGAIICYLAIYYFKKKIKIDDTLDVFALHGIGGIWGAIATGIFASTEANPNGNDGLIHGNGMQVVHQLVDVGISIVLGIVGTYIILKVMGLFMNLRVSEQEEREGLDLSQHGEQAYNSFEPGTSDSYPQITVEPQALKPANSKV